jgi:hypothetical protein
VSVVRLVCAVLFQDHLFQLLSALVQDWFLICECKVEVCCRVLDRRQNLEQCHSKSRFHKVFKEIIEIICLVQKVMRSSRKHLVNFISLESCHSHANDKIHQRKDNQNGFVLSSLDVENDTINELHQLPEDFVRVGIELLKIRFLAVVKTRMMHRVIHFINVLVPLAHDSICQRTYGRRVKLELKSLHFSKSYFADLNFESLDVFSLADALSGQGKVLGRPAFKFLEFGGNEHCGGTDDLSHLLLNVWLFGHEVIEQHNCQMVSL